MDSSVYAPQGFLPAYSLSGIIRGQGPTPAFLSGYATNVYHGYPIAVNAAGNMVVAAAGDRALGVFSGVEYVDSLGKQTYSNKWLANTVATNILAYYILDPNMVYQLQANDTLDITAIGQQYDWTALSGNATTGLATVGLDVASAAANAGVRVIGLVPGANNNWGDSFPWVLVQFSQHQYVADIASV